MQRGEVKNVVHQLIVTLEDLYNDATRKAVLQKNVVCDKSEGRGGKKGAVERCPSCRGHQTGHGGHQTGTGGHQTGPGVHQTGPGGHQAGPGGNQTGPGGHQAGPGGHQTGPGGHQTGPGGHQMI